MGSFFNIVLADTRCYEDLQVKFVYNVTDVSVQKLFEIYFIFKCYK